MEIETSWSRAGRKKGRQEGRQEGMLLVVSKQLSLRFGTLDKLMIERLETLAAKELEALSGELLEFRDVADLEQWLKVHGAVREKTQ